MEVWKKISPGAIPGLIKGVFVSAMFALAWMNMAHVVTFLFIDMESYVQFGFAGVILLVMLLSYLVIYATYHHQVTLLYMVLLFAAAFLTESVLERQSGILLFTIIISGEWIQLHRNKLLTLTYR